MEAAGIEPDPGRSTNRLMAHDFRCKTLIPRRFSPSIESPGVPYSPLESTPVMETFWRRKEARRLLRMTWPPEIGPDRRLQSGRIEVLPIAGPVLRPRLQHAGTAADGAPNNCSTYIAGTRLAKEECGLVSLYSRRQSWINRRARETARAFLARKRSRALQSCQTGDGHVHGESR